VRPWYPASGGYFTDGTVLTRKPMMVVADARGKAIGSDGFDEIVGRSADGLARRRWGTRRSSRRPRLRMRRKGYDARPLQSADRIFQVPGDSRRGGRPRAGRRGFSAMCRRAARASGADSRWCRPSSQRPRRKAHWVERNSGPASTHRASEMMPMPYLPAKSGPDGEIATHHARACFCSGRQKLKGGVVHGEQ